jgi:hypothetical protein
VTGKTVEELYDRVLVSVGRQPNAADLGLENTKVERDERGFIKVDGNMQTADPHLYAIGDIAGGVLLAHKASKEARMAVESLAGEPSRAAKITIPAVVFTHPEIAWCGLTEAEAKAQGRAIEVAKFPWAASGRALTCDATEGSDQDYYRPLDRAHLGRRHHGPARGRHDCRGEWLWWRWERPLRIWRRWFIRIRRCPNHSWRRPRPFLDTAPTFIPGSERNPPDSRCLTGVFRPH